MVGIPRCNEPLCEAALYQLKLLDKHGVLHKEDSLLTRLELLVYILHTGDSETAMSLKQQLALIKWYNPEN